MPATVARSLAAIPLVRSRLRRPVLLAVLAAVLAWVALLPPQTRRLDAGRPADVLWLDGAADTTTYRGVRGRWTLGEGRLRLDLPEMPARLRLRLATVESRVPDTVQVVRDGTVSPIRLGRAWNEVDLALPAARRGPSVIALRSAVTDAPDGPGRGLFIDRVEVTTGGLAGAGLAAWFWMALTFSGMLVAAAIAQPAAARPEPEPVRGLVGAWHRDWLPILAGIAVLALAVLFREAIVGHPRSSAALAWTFAAGVGLCCIWRAPAWLSRAAPLFFAAAALVLVGGLFREAWIDGRVLSQADMLYDHTPWREHRPPDWRPLPRPPFGDVPMFVYPFHRLALERWRAGELPLWTPAVGAGVPVLANYQSALFSPFTWLLGIAALPGATVLIATCRLLVGGVGMFLFLRHIGLSAWASSVGGLAYLLSPVTIVWLEHPLGNVAPWLPWMLLSADRAAAGGMAAGGALALVTALTLLGGHPHLALYIVALGAAYACARTLGGPSPVRRLAGVLACLGLGAAAASVQILPFLEYATQSRTIEMRNAYALNPFVAPVGAIVTALVPDFFGHPAAANYAGPLNYLEQLNYAGAGVLVLAAAGVGGAGRAWRPWFFASVVVACCLAMYGAPLVHHAISMVPLVRSASLLRLAFLVAGALAILAAFGTEALLSAGEPRRRRLLTIAAAAPALVAVALLATRQGARSFLIRSDLVDVVAAASAASFAFVAIAAGVIVLRVRHELPRAVTAFVLASCLVAELFLFARGFHPLIDPADVFPTTPEIARMQADGGLFRVVAAGGGLLPDTAIAYGLQDPRWYDGIGIKAYGELLDAAFHWGDAFHAALRFESPLFDLLNVRYVLGPPDLALPADRFTRLTHGGAALFRNERAVPRAFLVDRFRVESGSAARRLLRDGGIDYRREVLLETMPDAADRPEAAPTPREVGEARVRRYDAEHVAIQTEAPGRRLLVLTDTWFPGWIAEIDGQAVPIVRANVAFRAVAVPPGGHVVTFRYRPSSVRTGAWLSAGALAGIGLLMAFGRVRHPVPAGEASAS